MGKISFFTKEQQLILDLIKQNAFLQSQFYFTGGTALSAYYLQHRYSDDLDFFSKSRFDNEVILTLVEEWSQKHGFTFRSRFVEVVYIFNLTFGKNTFLKVDFAYYPHRKIEKETIIDGIGVDSLTDIAVNKLFTISQRTNIKDFVDLYFLLQKFSVWDLLSGVRVKFGMELEPILVGSDFLKAETFEFLPKMIKPLTLAELKTFFREKAKEIAGKSVK